MNKPRADRRVETARCDWFPQNGLCINTRCGVRGVTKTEHLEPAVNHTPPPHPHLHLQLHQQRRRRRCCAAPLRSSSSSAPSASPPASRCRRRRPLPAGHASPPAARVSVCSTRCLWLFFPFSYCSLIALTFVLKFISQPGEVHLLLVNNFKSIIF